MNSLILVFFFSSSLWSSTFENDARILSLAIKESLLKELSSSIKKNGPEKSIEFCHENVGEIYKISDKTLAEKYEFGRTSLKVRNSKNKPSEWIIKYLKNYQKSNSTKSAIHIFDDGKKAYLEPLFVGGLCLQCHGENVTPQLIKKIKEYYPNDNATGYKINEFRGFIWVNEK